jgi:hypothetical protein
MSERVIPRIPVTFQLVVNSHPANYDLFEMDYDEMPAIWPGMLLMNVPGVPNIVGQAAEFDNRIVRLAYDGLRKRMLAQIGSVRCPTDTLAEMKLKLPEWRHVRELKNVDDRDLFTG